MATTEFNSDNLRNIIDNNPIVIIDFWAPWCGPCRSFGPIYEETSNKEEHQDIIFGKVNTEEAKDLAATFQIRSIPTLIIFREKIIVFSQPGAIPGKDFEDIIQKVKEIDMDKVRKDIENSE